MFAEILNPFIKTRNQIKNKKGVWVDEKEKRETSRFFYANNRNISGAPLIIFNDIEHKIIIDYFELSSSGSHSAVFPRLHLDPSRSGRTENNMFIGSNGGSIWDLTHNYVDQYGNAFMESALHNTSRSLYKMVNKRPIILGEGGKLGIYSASNYNPNNHDYKVMCNFRLIEE